MEENNIIDVTENIKNEIKSNDVVLFMKGTPVFPMCGFSAATVQVLSDMGVKFSSVNVLDSNEMREGIKKFSNYEGFTSIPLLLNNSRSSPVSCISLTMSHPPINSSLT